MLNSTIGFLGAGQLAKMSALAAFRYGHQVSFYSDRFNKKVDRDPSYYISPNFYGGDFSDLNKIEEFSTKCDVITLENEFIDPNILKFLESDLKKRVAPNFLSFKQVSNKLMEKETFRNLGIPVVPYLKLNEQNLKDELLVKFIQKYSFPFIMKSSYGGYDGYGNAKVNNLDEIETNYIKLSKNGKSEVFIEAFIPFDKELAVTVAQNSFESVVYPCVETIQENHICKLVLAPASIDQSISDKIKKYALTAMKGLNAIGVFTFEFFVTKSGEIFLNESAPRPHNSAHYTIDACYSSQFDNHIRAVMDYPLGNPQMIYKHAIMLNLLATENGKAQLDKFSNFLDKKNGFLHLYGKEESKKGRKMGHYTLVGDNFDLIFDIISKLKAEVKL